MTKNPLGLPECFRQLRLEITPTTLEAHSTIVTKVFQPRDKPSKLWRLSNPPSATIASPEVNVHRHMRHLSDPISWILRHCSWLVQYVIRVGGVSNSSMGKHPGQVSEIDPNV